ncbi:MAG: DUF58 domain-containing protein [Clostridia bacterium]|nr:DUF58 domain-containing protein [Clostridia bacterium]
MNKRRAIWAGWLVLTALLAFFENNTGTKAVFLASLVLPLFSLGCALLSARRLTLTLDGPESVLVGEEAMFVCRASGPRWLLLCAVSGLARCRNALTGEITEYPLLLPGARPARFRVDTARCGGLTVEVTAGAVQDFAGLWRVPVEGPRRLITVAPLLFPVTILTGESGGADDGAWDIPAPRRGTEGQGSGGVRPYLSGDSVQRMHWKLSAKMNRLLLRESDRPAAEVIWLVLDAPPGAFSPDAIAGAAETLLSVSWALTQIERPHEVMRREMEEDGMAVTCAEDFFRMRDALLHRRALPAAYAGDVPPPGQTLCFGPAGEGFDAPESPEGRWIAAGAKIVML